MTPLSVRTTTIEAPPNTIWMMNARCAEKRNFACEFNHTRSSKARKSGSVVTKATSPIIDHRVRDRLFKHTCLKMVEIVLLAIRFDSEIRDRRSKVNANFDRSLADERGGSRKRRQHEMLRTHSNKKVNGPATLTVYT